MCGLCGVIHRDPSCVVDEGEFLVMRDSRRHRGPDDAGHYLGSGVVLGSRLLSILDLSECGRMPMSTIDGRYVVVYNDEVYHLPALHQRLLAKCYTFRLHTD